jgi:hypothetical protein
MPGDLFGAPVSCGPSGVAQSCAGASTINGCYVCNLDKGGGTCAVVCSLLAQLCPTGQSCVEFTFGDAGATGNVAVEGSNCAGFGYCR